MITCWNLKPASACTSLAVLKIVCPVEKVAYSTFTILCYHFSNCFLHERGVVWRERRVRLWSWNTVTNDKMKLYVREVCLNVRHALPGVLYSHVCLSENNLLFISARLELLLDGGLSNYKVDHPRVTDVTFPKTKWWYLKNCLLKSSNLQPLASKSRSLNH